MVMIAQNNNRSNSLSTYKEKKLIFNHLKNKKQPVLFYQGCAMLIVPTREQHRFFKAVQWIHSRWVLIIVLRYSGSSLC